MKAHYTPTHAILVVSGPVLAADVKFEVARAFAGLTGSNTTARLTPVRRVPPPMPEEPPEDSPLAVFQGPGHELQLHLMLTVPGFHEGTCVNTVIAAQTLAWWVEAKLQGDERSAPCGPGTRRWMG